jgi:hypothetical protein
VRALRLCITCNIHYLLPDHNHTLNFRTARRHHARLLKRLIFTKRYACMIVECKGWKQASQAPPTEGCLWHGQPALQVSGVRFMVALACFVGLCLAVKCGQRVALSQAHNHRVF